MPILPVLRSAWLRRLIVAVAVACNVPVKAVDNIPPGGEVWLQGYDGSPPTSGFSNAGLLRMGAPDTPQPVSLIVTNGLMTNLPTGTFWVGTGSDLGGDFIVWSDLLNQGTVRISYSVYFTKPRSAVDNEGMFKVFPGQGAFFYALGQSFNQNGGTLALEGAAFHMKSGYFRYRGGTITGYPYLVDTTLAFSPTATNAATFVLSGGNCGLSGDVPAGCVVWLQANGAGGNTRVSTLGFVNHGDLRMDSVQGPSDAVVVVDEGALVNGPTGLIEANPGSGGVRVIEGLLVNDGRLEVRGNLELRSPTGPHTNAGAIHVGADASLRARGGLIQTTGSVQLAQGTLNAFVLATNLVVVTNGTVVTTKQEIVTRPGRFGLEGGLLTGSGTVASHLVNAAELRLEARAGPMTISGNYTQAAAGLLTLNLEGLTSGSPTPVLTVASNVQLDGRLVVQLTNTAGLHRGDSFKLLQAGFLTGAFQSRSLPELPLPLRFELVSRADGLDLRIALDYLQTSQPRVLPDGSFGLTASGLPASKVILDASTKLLDWLPIQTNAPFPGTLELVDRDAVRFERRFYRAYRVE